MKRITLSSACAAIALATALTGGVSGAMTSANAAEFETQKCINIGNTLEAPRDASWGNPPDKRYFEVIGGTNIDTVRIPVRWSAYAPDEAPYTIEDDWFDTVDEMIGWALAEDLKVILNVHHYDELYEKPRAHREKFVALWEQIAAHYQDYPDTLYFEILNEPRDALSGDLMQAVLLDGLAAIRDTNPERIVIIGGDQWNSIRGLPSIPETPGDENIVHTFHYYDPHEFTHQKAPWAGLPEDREVDWGSDEELAQVVADAERARAHAEETGYKVLLGEYGVYDQVPLEKRLPWTAVVTKVMSDRGIATCPWAFANTFPVWDKESEEWLPGMKEALGVVETGTTDADAGAEE